ncbi:DUF3108 domain-containing protein [Flavobacterium sp. CS20]|uniref:DUF3108 domain-containing protein n=1 Tax=Flavobacterium sp. CS20 TaxID=2775246 RepID=UPI001FFD59BA|nr:DUF3108 domain-containing protein [Flavobacterium sp. CS20]
MKTFITTLTLLLSLNVMGQSNCSKYYPFNKDHVSEYEMFNKKGKADGTMKYTVSNVTHSEGSITVTINSEFFDKKGKPVMSSAFDMSCNGGTVTMDFKSLMNADMMKQFDNFETEITGTNVEFPNTLTAGQTLPDANIHIKMNMGGINMTMTTDITNRKVDGTETITTPAGTFDCVVVSQSSSGKMMMVKFNSTQKTWLAEGVGMVKSEDYNGNGKLQGTTVLTSYSQ